MTKKLTLSMDEALIEKIKRLAEENNTSVSAMIAQYVRSLEGGRKGGIAISPAVRKISGIVKMPKGKSDRDVLTEALMEKYGIRK